MKNYRIVLTGGPCAGKTEILNALTKHIRETYSYSVYQIPETATEVISSVITPAKCDNILFFQELILSRQFNKEQTVANIIKHNINYELGSVTICDRGILDNRAYLNNQKDFDYLLNKFNLHEITIADNYDMVIDLISTANSDEVKYNRATNEIRLEEEELARSLDNNTSNAWNIHRHLVIIDCKENIADKIAEVFKHVDNLLNGCFTKENYKYILDLKKSDFSLYNDDNSKEWEEEMFYLEQMLPVDRDIIIKRRSYKNTYSYIFSIERENAGQREILDEEVISMKEALTLIKKWGILDFKRVKHLSFVRDKIHYNINICKNKGILETSIPIDNLNLAEGIVIKEKNIIQDKKLERKLTKTIINNQKVL